MTRSRRRGAAVGQVVPEPVSSPGRRTTPRRHLDRAPPPVANRHGPLGHRAFATLGLGSSAPPRQSPTSTTSRRASTGSSTRPSRPPSGSTTPSSSSPSSSATSTRSTRRPAAPGRLAGRGPRRAPGLHRQPVPGPEPGGRRPGHRLRRPERLPLRPVHDVGLPGRPGPALRRLRHRGQGARHPRGRDRRPARARSSAPRPSSPRRRPRSRRSTARPRRCSTELKEEERAALLSRGSIRLPPGSRPPGGRRPRSVRDGAGG